MSEMNRFEIKTVRVTPEDIKEAQQDGAGDPFAVALRRVTGTPWKMSGWGVAIEMSAPYRTLVLPCPALRAWQIYQHTGSSEPFEFTAEICTPADGKKVL